MEDLPWEDMPKWELALSRPLMNAAGTLGFSPDPYAPVDFSRFGAFVTNPVSLAPRTPTRGPRFVPAPGSFLLHTGHPNPGLSAVLRGHSGRWARSPLPVIVHLLAQSVDDAGAMVQRLEGLEGVMGVEVSLPPGADAAQVQALAQAVIGELPAVLRVPLDRIEAVHSIIPKLAEIGVAALSLGPPRGALPELSGVLASGRLYGPALFPLGLSAVQSLAQSGLPVIAGCGVYASWQIQAALAAGAFAVQLDSVLWRGGY